MTGTVQECCAPLPGPHPIAGGMCYLLTPYGDIHHGMSYLLMPYSDIHTRQLLPIYTTMTDDYRTVQECCGAPFPGPHPITSSMCYLLMPYSDIHSSMSYLLTLYGDGHTRHKCCLYILEC